MGAANYFMNAPIVNNPFMNTPQSFYCIHPSPINIHHPYFSTPNVQVVNPPLGFVPPPLQTNPITRKRRRCKGFFHQNYMKFVRPEESCCFKISSKKDEDEKVARFDPKQKKFFAVLACNHDLDERGICSNCCSSEAFLEKRNEKIQNSVLNRKIIKTPTKFLDTPALQLLKSDCLLNVKDEKMKEYKKEIHSTYLQSIDQSFHAQLGRLKEEKAQRFADIVKTVFQNRRDASAAGSCSAAGSSFGNSCNICSDSPYCRCSVNGSSIRGSSVNDSSVNDSIFIDKYVSLEQEFEEKKKNLYSQRTDLLNQSSKVVLDLCQGIIKLAKEGKLDEHSFMRQFLYDHISNSGKDDARQRRYSDLMMRFW